MSSTRTQLVVLTTRLEHFDNFSTRRHLLDDIVITIDQLTHTLLDCSNIIRSEGSLVGDIVIEALINHRPNNHSRRWIKLLHGVPNQMRTGVTNDLQPFLILRGDDLQRNIAIDQVTGIDQPAIDLACHGRLGKTGANGLSHFGNGNGMIKRTLTAIGKSNGGHGASSPSGDPYQRPHGLG
jgi:hypothetical protein